MCKNREHNTHKLTRFYQFYSTFFFCVELAYAMMYKHQVVGGYLDVIMIGSIIDKDGIVNNFLASLGMERINWFYHKTLTMPTVIFITMLHGMGNNMVIFLSAMKNVPTEYYEAAHIDGASGFNLFFRVTIPLISPTLFLGVVTTCIGALKAFGSIYALTGGGPANRTSVFVYYIFKLAFKQGKMGYASAVSTVLFGLILILTLVQWIMRKRFVYNEV